MLPLACQKRGKTKKIQAKCVLPLLGGIRAASEQAAKVFNAKEGPIAETQYEKQRSNRKSPQLSFNSLSAALFLELLQLP